MHKNLSGVGSNVKQDKIFDQIAFIAPDLKDKLEDCNAGVFNFYESVYRAEDEAVFRPDIPKTASGNPGRYNDWRTYQMSDHLIMWCEFDVDQTDTYLQFLADAND